MTRRIVDADVLDPLRQSVAKAITDLSAFQGTAGSEEMEAVMCALMCLGQAYSALLPVPVMEATESGSESEMGMG
jgi:hypothetical protein